MELFSYLPYIIFGMASVSGRVWDMFHGCDGCVVGFAGSVPDCLQVEKFYDFVGGD
jgi:hypothetical protein